MRKLTKKSLDELAQRMPVLSEKVQSSFIGGGTGTRENPFTFGEYKDLGSLFTEGWVDLPDSISYLTHDYDYYFGDSGYDMLSFLGGSGYDGASGYWGGSGYDGASGYWDGSDSGENNSECKPSCVFYAFDYFDGDRYDWCHYYNETKKNLGYEPNSNGGVKTSDIPTIGSYGRLLVEELNMESGIRLTLNGKTEDGRQVMMTFFDGIEDHAVVVTGSTEINGIMQKIYYFDPTNNIMGDIDFDNCASFYAVSRIQ